jgi:acetyl esterase
VVERRELTYPGPAGDPMPATLYRPAGEGPFGAVIELAGGGWVSGDRSNNETVNLALAERGLAVLAIEVSKPPVAGYPQAIADVNRATRWFKGQAEALGCRGDRLGGLGSSSGGHQIMLSALRYADPLYAGSEEDGPDASFACVAACWPVLDPLARYRMARAKGKKQLVGNHDAYWSSETAMGQGSPQAIVEAGEAMAMPPLLLIQGGTDENVPPAMTLRFAEAYCAAGGEVELSLFPGQPHSFIRREPDGPASHAAVDRLAHFLGHRVNAG